MSFYLRKSIKVGPMRFNLSKSGLGVSAGIRGLRFGTGPRGNYVHMGLNGLYYRRTLPQSQVDEIESRPESDAQPRPQEVDMQEIESGDVSQMTDSSSTELLAELNQKRRKTRLLPVAAIGAGLLVLLVWALDAPGWAVPLSFAVGGLGVFVSLRRDELAKTAVLFYDFDDGMETAYGQLHEAAGTLADCAKVWHIEAEGDVGERKYHAGASHLVKRQPTTIQRSQPPNLRTNVETVAIAVGRQTLHFFPDRILVYDKDGVGAVPYRSLRVEVGDSQFIEHEGVPSDAQVVGRTWQYVNKKGGPDRRFKDNPELPICLYEQIDLVSETGLNERVQVSRTGVGLALAESVASLASVLPSESPTAPSNSTTR